MGGLILSAESHVLPVKSCSVMGDAVPALRPPWVKSCICYVSVVSWLDHSLLYNRTEIVTVACQATNSCRREMTLAELTGTELGMMMKYLSALWCKVVTAVGIQNTRTCTNQTLTYTMLKSMQDLLRVVAPLIKLFSVFLTHCHHFCCSHV